MEAKYTKSDLNLARLAAYIDGEGTVDLQRASQGKNRAPSFKLRIVVYNTDIRLLAWCKKHFGGNVRANRKGTSKYPPLYMWELSGAKTVVALLEKCLPFFVIKREQAEIGITFGNTFSPSNRDPRGLGEAVRSERESLRSKIFVIRRVKPGSEAAA